MRTARIVSGVTVMGTQLRNITDDITADNVMGPDKTVTAAKVGQLTTRTDANTGTLTMAASHGIITGDKIDLFWDGGSRYNMTVGTVSVNSVPIDLGGGDNLPTNLTAITAKVVEVELGTVAGDSIQFIALYTKYAGRVTFRDAAHAVLWTKLLEDAETYAWSVNSGVTNPLAGAAVVEVALSTGDSDNDSPMLATVLYN